MPRHGMVWHRTAWCGVAWHGVAWHDMIGCGMPWCAVVCRGAAWCGRYASGVTIVPMAWHVRTIHMHHPHLVSLVPPRSPSSPAPCSSHPMQPPQPSAWCPRASTTCREQRSWHVQHGMVRCVCRWHCMVWHGMAMHGTMTARSSVGHPLLFCRPHFDDHGGEALRHQALRLGVPVDGPPVAPAVPCRGPGQGIEGA